MLEEWKDSYRVGVKEIDDQHQRWFEIMNTLHDSIAAGVAGEVVGAALQEVIEYTRSHFAHEEQLMARTAYPEFPEHKGEHDAFIAQVALMRGNASHNIDKVAMDIVLVMRDWLLKHVLTTDLRYVAHFRAKGISA